MKIFNEDQQKVINTNNNILVIAGPGSGKTTTIIEKVNYLLKNNNPEDIVLISFTNQSVNDIKNRLNNNILVCTFHMLAIDILNTYNINYKIVNQNKLNYIIDEYLITYENKYKLLNYLKVKNLDKYNIKYLKFKKLIISFINLFKTNGHDINKLYNLINNYHDKFLIKIILDILNTYENEKNSTNEYDFDDLIIYATKLLNNNYQYKKFKYIIIDEFQDTSLIRYNLIKAIYDNSNSIITAVGDDAQSIFHFSGCDINIFLNFNKYFPNSEILFLKTTYRNSSKLVQITSEFINKNKNQIKKNMISNINIDNPIEYIYYFDRKKTFKKFLINNINKNILILGRNKKDIYDYIDSSFSYNKNIIKFNNKEFKYLTMHSAKGLEEDYVLIINLYNNITGIPSQIPNSEILNYITTETDNYPFAEERRLFFVALTRCKIKTYLLIPYFNKSIFVKELKKIISS